MNIGDLTRKKWRFHYGISTYFNMVNLGDFSAMKNGDFIRI